MPDFAYVARNLEGEKVTGTVSAGSEREAVNILSGQSLFPVEVAPDDPSSSDASTGRIRGQMMAATYTQMASLLRSGVPLLKTLAIIRDQSSNARLKAVLDDVHGRVEEGATLAEAMSRHPKAFSEMAVNMIRAGGEGGFLEDALVRVATFTEQQLDLKSRTVGALAYPVFLGTAGTLIIIILIVFFVPKFGELFEQLRERGELPFMTDLLLNFSEGIWSWGWLVILGGTVLFALAWSRLSTEEGRRWKDGIKLRTPMAGSIYQNLAVARFCRVLGTLLTNGVPILKSLEISRGAAGNRIISDAIAEASENITSGQSLSGPLSKSGYFPKTVTEMITVAEESATLDSVLIQIADDLEKRTFRRMDLMVRMIEPVMLLALAGVVLCVVIALLMPIIKLGTTI